LEILTLFYIFYLSKSRTIGNLRSLGFRVVSKRRLAEYEHPSNGILQLWERIQEVWEGIPVEECQKLIESMPRRVQAVVKAKGGYTKC